MNELEALRHDIESPLTLLLLDLRLMTRSSCISRLSSHLPELACSIAFVTSCSMRWRIDLGRTYSGSRRSWMSTLWKVRALFDSPVELRATNAEMGRLYFSRAVLQYSLGRRRAFGGVCLAAAAATMSG